MSATLPIEANDRTVTREATVAGQTEFTFDFPIQYETDLAVEVAAAATPTVFTALSFASGDFTVSGVGEEHGGTVTLTAGRSIGDLVTIAGATPIERTWSIIRGGLYRATAADADLDRATMIAQELRRDFDRLSTMVTRALSTMEILAAVIGVSPTVTAVLQWRVRRALQYQGLLWTIANSIPADPTDPVAIAWTSSPIVSAGDHLWAHIRDTLEWTDDQMVNLVALALQMDP